MIFQHGEAPDDYVLAHAFAMAAHAGGRPEAAWIAAATFSFPARALNQAR